MNLISSKVLKEISKVKKENIEEVAMKIINAIHKEIIS